MKAMWSWCAWILAFRGVLVLVKCSEASEDGGSNSVRPHHYSPTDLVNLMRFDKDVYLVLRNHVDNMDMDRRLDYVESYLKDFDDGVIEPSTQLSYEMDDWTWCTLAVYNPVTAFRMMHRLSSKLVDAINQLESEQELGLIEEILHAKGELVLPTAIEVQPFLASLLQLQFIYDLHAHEFSSGIFPPLAFQASLTSQQQVELRHMAIADGKHATGIEWLSSAIAAGFRGTYDSDPYELLRMIHADTQSHDRLLAEQARTRKDKRNLWYVDLFQSPIAELSQFSGMKLRHLDQNVRNEYRSAAELCYKSMFHDYFPPPKPRSDEEVDVDCWYYHETHPFLFIAPLKAELLSSNPYLLLIHDFAGDNLVLQLLETAIPQQLAKTVPLKPVLTGQGMKAQDKVWSFSALEGYNEFSQLTHKLLQVTGRKIIQETPVIHAMSYTTNFRLPAKAGDKNRYGTLMVFLNDVNVGGSTIFPGINRTVQPRKGSALIWLNKLMKGSLDSRIEQLDCPPFGFKWVAEVGFQKVDD